MDKPKWGSSIRKTLEETIIEQAEKIERYEKALEEIIELSKHDGISRYLDKCYITAKNSLNK